MNEIWKKTLDELIGHIDKTAGWPKGGDAITAAEFFAKVIRHSGLIDEGSSEIPPYLMDRHNLKESLADSLMDIYDIVDMIVTGSWD
jgi:hypothetical protein